MKYFLDESQRKATGSTSYFEFQKGKFRHKFWLKDSLCLHVDIFDSLMLYELFFKKYMNEDAGRAFWAWFAEQEEWIIDCISRHDAAFVWAIDERLKPVFPYFRGELEFQLGYNDGVGEFFFFHFGKKDLIRDGKTLGEMMPAELKKKWKFILER